MRTALLAFCLGSCLLAPSALAEEATGKVRSIYYEAARGVLVDAKLLRSGSARRWADVELDGGQASEGKRLLVQVPSSMSAAIGDVVAVRVGEPKSTQLAEILPATTENRALAVTPQTPQFAGNASSAASAIE